MYRKRFIVSRFTSVAMADETPTKSGLARVKQNLPPDVTLVVVTKGRTLGQIQKVIELGCRTLGENRVKEAAEKIPECADVEGLRWHMIGHLQRNKAKRACELFDMIQSVDRLKLANALDRHCSALEKRIPVLIEVNIGEEEQKHGIPIDEAMSLVKQVAELSNLQLQGLMCMAPFIPAEQTRPYFKRMRLLFDNIAADLKSPDFTVLSMGMTSDYPIAVEEGSTMVRIGRAIFESSDT